MEISNRVAVVTGGASGIGACMATRFAREGAAGVVVADVNLERAQGVARGIGAQAVAIGCDVTREADIQEMVRQTRERFGRWAAEHRRVRPVRRDQARRGRRRRVASHRLWPQGRAGVLPVPAVGT